ncbi:hypothetical protein BS78_05G085200 [Paspalum vaginatum]|nr:hypothetical protein BS78_05G085200 [Paspalum vaginatum]
MHRSSFPLVVCCARFLTCNFGTLVWHCLPAESIFWSSITCSCCSGGNEISCLGVSCNTCFRRATPRQARCRRAPWIF